MSNEIKHDNMERTSFSEGGILILRKVAKWLFIISVVGVLSVGLAEHAQAQTDLVAIADAKVVYAQEELDLEEPVYLEGNRLFISSRFLIDYLESRAIWHQDTKQLELMTDNDNHIVFTLDSQEVTFNGETYHMEVEPFVHDGRTYLPARELADFLHVSISWDRQEKIVMFQPIPYYEVQAGETLLDISEKLGIPVSILKKINELDGIYLYEGDELKTVIPTVMTEPQDEINEEDLQLLAKIIQIESGYEPLEGQIAVGNVILNRVKDERFPNTIKEVIFQPNQFPPAANGKLDTVEPSESAWIAAEKVLRGEMVVEGALYFYNPKVTGGSFFESRPLVAEIGNHRFIK